MTLRKAKSVLAGHWPASPTDDRWMAEVDSSDLDQLWQTCAFPAPMLIALLHLGADRQACARATVACLRQLRPLFTPKLVQGPLASIEQFVASGATDPDAHRRSRDICQQEDVAPQGGVALAVLALSASIDLLDAADPFPVTGAEIDCMADALFEAGLTASGADARKRLAEAVRQEIPTLAGRPGLDPTTGDVPHATPDALPF